MFLPKDTVVKVVRDFMNIKNIYKTLEVSFENKIITCSINRPKQLNALNSEVIFELHQFFDEVKKLVPSQKCFGVILTGSGEKSFVAGADIKEMSGLTTEKAFDFGKLGQELTIKIEELDCPVIACVNGFALGGGCELAMACDFIYASNNALFGQPEAKLGLIPGFGGTQRLARYIGRNKAKEIIYTGRNMSADEAYSRGLVLNLFDNKDSLLEHAKNTLITIGKSSMNAIASCKKSVNDGVDKNIKDSLENELDLFSKCFSTDTSKEGMRAFIEKRKADFK